MDESKFPSDFAVDGRIEDGTRTDDVLGLGFAIICDWRHGWDGWKCCPESHKRIPDLCRLHLDEEWVHGNTEIHCVWNLDGAKRIDVI